MTNYKSLKMPTNAHLSILFCTIAFLCFSHDNLETYRGIMQWFVPFDFTYQAVAVLNHILERDKHRFTIFNKDSWNFKVLESSMSVLEVVFNKNLRRVISLISNFRPESLGSFGISLVGMLTSMFIQIYAENKFMKIEKKLEEISDQTQVNNIKESPLGLFSNFSIMNKAFWFNIAKYQPEDILDFKPVVKSYVAGEGVFSMIASFFKGLGRSGQLAFVSANVLGILDDGEKLIETQRATKLLKANEEALKQNAESNKDKKLSDPHKGTSVVEVLEPIKAVLIKNDCAIGKPFGFVDRMKNSASNSKVHSR